MNGTMDHVTREHPDSFLIESAAILASSLEFEHTLAALAQLAVRALGDFCIIDVVDHDGEIRRLQVAHADPDRAALTAELLRFPIDARFPHPSLQVLRTGQPVVVRSVTPAVLDAVAQDGEHRSIMDSLEPRSLLAVPLLAHTQIVGVMLLGSSTSIYDADDVVVAEKLALLAGLEVDNARHYRAAQQALEARDRVLGVVAHDLRNPLNTIIMAAGLIRDFPLAPEQLASRIQMILTAAQRMNRLIQDLLDVARLEAGRLVLERTDNDAVSIANEAVDLSAARAATKSLRLRVESAPDLPLISVDRDRILRVFTNIIDNAIRFTPDGGRIVIGVTTRGDDVCFSVADTGPGIAPDDADHLFEPFWQRQGGGEGAGLGLTIARGITEAHGGKISVDSTPGHGATFCFTVPPVCGSEPLS